MSVASRFVLAGALVAASVSVAGPAEAAKACVLGKWKSTSQRLIIQGSGGETHGNGVKGVRLTITRTSLAYDFDKSTRETLVGSSLGSPTFRSWVKYTKKLKVKATVKGSKKGTVVLKPKTARGDATGTGATTWPEYESMGRWNIAENVREGVVEDAVPVKSSFSCSGRTLKFFSSFKHRGYDVFIGRVFTRA
ncbi:hypothetical protein ABGB12_05345 [Actinocorallia sp. B10E7]|uniref:hypothetical protein n=1 Tax=Actinocorallia sp. B10E7 TaxID=3153558 RepID=UPI00325CCE38